MNPEERIAHLHEKGDLHAAATVAVERRLDRRCWAFW